MKIFLSVICIIFFLSVILISLYVNKLRNIEYQKPEILSGKKILIAYYSNGGNTKNVAQNLQSITGADIIEIKLLENYPDNIFKMSEIVRTQMKQGYFPSINDIDISNYDIIFIGSPIWNFSISLPVKSFLKKNNFDNKVLIPFFTCSGGASKNKIIKEIQADTNSKDIKMPLFMFENGIFLVKEQIINWLNNI